MVGVNVRDIDSIDRQYKCIVCKLLLKDPIQLSCGHRQCESCIQKPIQDTIQCLECNQPILTQKMFRDRGIMNDMEQIAVKCFECSWEGRNKDYQIHSTKHFLVKEINKYTKNYFSLKSSMLNCFQDKNQPTESKIDFISHNGILFVNMINIQSSTFPTTSPDFYTSLCGYKLRIHFQLHGTFIDQSAHLSASVTIMRGEYDAQLNWPCDLQFIFSLYDLRNQNYHLIKSVQSDTNSLCFQKPQTEMNDSYDLSSLIPWTTILQENDLHFQVMIREEPIPIDILSQIMTV